MSDPDHPDTETKTAFARRIGVTKGRVSQLVTDGLPVNADGSIPVAAALAWFNGRTDPRKRMAKGKPPLPGAGADAGRLLLESKAIREQAKAEREKLALAKDRKALIERATVERVVFARSRAERDGYSAWLMRVAPLIAGEIGCDAGALWRAMDRELRRHQQEMADTPLFGVKENEHG